MKKYSDKIDANVLQSNGFKVYIWSIKEVEIFSIYMYNNKLIIFYDLGNPSYAPELEKNEYNR